MSPSCTPLSHPLQIMHFNLREVARSDFPPGFRRRKIVNKSQEKRKEFWRQDADAADVGPVEVGHDLEVALTVICVNHPLVTPYNPPWPTPSTPTCRES